MNEVEKEEVHRARLIIEGNRAANNTNFMDWWEASMLCPICRPKALRYQAVIRHRDNDTSRANERVAP